MDLIERYIYGVTQQLPDKQRLDIRRELQSLIEDMLEERAPGGQAKRADVESVLLELGPPNALAAKYRGSERYFIGPTLYSPYMNTLKIVLASIAIAMTVVMALEAFVSNAGVAAQITDYIVTVFSAGAQGFLWVTLIFAWLQFRQHQDAGEAQAIEPEWKPSELPEVPDQTAHIKMSEPIASIFFTVFAMAILLYAVDWIGVWRIDDGNRIAIPLLNGEAFRSYLPFVWIIGALGILEGCVRIWVRNRSPRLLLFHSAICFVIAVLSCIIAADASIWNPAFAEQMADAGIIAVGGEGYQWLTGAWDRIQDWMIAIIILTTLIELASETYSTYRVRKVR